MKYLNLVLLLLAPLISFGQEQKPKFDPGTWVAPYKLSVPDGWNMERFQIPIEFAPAIPYSGVEDLRFTPGWGDPKSEDYWTYSFLWFLDGKQKFKAETFEQYLQAYYSGLVERNIESRKIPKEKLFPVSAKFQEVKEEPGDTGTYKGTVHMLDYMQQKPITLNCLIHVRDCPNLDNTIVFYEISPQQSTHSIWNSLNQIWLEFECSAN
jgi:hypothetical protein